MISAIHTALHWIRASVFILAVLILFLSLGRYSQDSVSIFTLLHSSPNDAVGPALIKDRRLIVTLVASQVSIFCPLFLLAGSVKTEITLGFWKTALDLLYQFLMPLALALCWLFCLSFDGKTELMLMMMTPSPSAPLASSTVYGLKYLIVAALALEMGLITMAWIEHCITSLHKDNTSFEKQSQAPLLPTIALE
ncbi:hypothetical protein [Absidia glauca]|uniref:Uncharacterized protein n=1 Tax=Absidia glauca TaxID=4829 RepID=A0A168QMP4_ABSGL|nr:hypothetical protein [Absidia glauca]